MPPSQNSRHQPGHNHAFTGWYQQAGAGLRVQSRRGVLKAGLAGLAGLTLPQLIAQRQAIGSPAHAASGKSVILLWMAGGPSHIDTWDPKPNRPEDNRGPFSAISTALPGVLLCEHLPKQAAMLDRMTLIRSVDAQFSNHEPNKVFQTGNLAAEGRTNPEAEFYPAIGSIVAKHHGANHPAMPPYVAFVKSQSHVSYAGYLGKQYDPFPAVEAASLPLVDYVGNVVGQSQAGGLFNLHPELSQARLYERRGLLSDLNSLRDDLDQNGSMRALDQYGRMAVEMITGDRARQAFDLGLEPASSHDRYGKHVWCQQALLARRLVESGVAFVTLDLSYHPASGTWDTHGDNIPPYGGIKNGLGPLLPLFDHLFTTLVNDLEERGLIDNVLVIAMGEFGRTPKLGTQDSADGRDHWPPVMSMAMAGGGLRHGQVIGSSERDGGSIKSRPVTPGDLAATLYQYFGVPLGTFYEDHRGRPRPVVESGAPIGELFA